MSLHLKLLDIDHPLTFEESKLRQIESHALIYLRRANQCVNARAQKKIKFLHFLSQRLALWLAICFKIMTRYTLRFFPTDTCNHSCYTIYVRFVATYTCVLSCFVGFLFSSIWPFSYKRTYICAQKSPYICVLQTSMCIWGHRKSSYKRHRIIPSAKNSFMYDRAEK